MRDWMEYTALAGLAVVLSYVMARVASFAYFRTKLEYARHYLQELRKDS